MNNSWKNIFGRDWQQLLTQSATGEPFVLFCTSVGSHGAVVTHDSLVAAALIARRARVEVLLCDGVLPACEACTYYNIGLSDLLQKGPQDKLCQPCWQQGHKAFTKVGIPVHRYSSFLTDQDQQDAQTIVAGLPDEVLQIFMLDGYALGEEAYAGTLRYFAVGDLSSESKGFAVMRRYLQGAILTLKAIQRVFAKLQPDVTVFHHGIYVPQGVIGRVARQEGIHVVNWSVGYRKQTFVYSHDDTYHRTMIDEPVAGWQERTLAPEEHTRLLQYLDARKNSAQDWIKFNQEPEERAKVIRERLGLDNRPMILLLTNVTWDAQLYYKNNGFPSLLDWLAYTIRYFADRTDLQLVIRVHPGEVRGTMRTRQPVMAEMAQRIPNLPTNVKVVDPEDDLSTYTLADMADCAIIFGTKTGVELTARGIPVIVAGEAWIRNKGLTIDVASEQEYGDCLDRLPLGYRMPDEQVELALKYAFHYFFRRLIPIKALVPVQPSSNIITNVLTKIAKKLEARKGATLVQSPYAVDIDNLAMLMPGGDPGLDVVCHGIVSGAEFVFESKTIDAS